VALDQLPALLREVDAAVFSATAAAPLVAAEDLRGRAVPLLLLDLAVPRNVEPAAGLLPGVRLVNVDELGVAARAGLDRREAAATRAAEVLDRELAGWRRWFKTTSAAPTLAALAAYADGIRSREVQRTLRALGEVDPELRRRIESLSKSLVSRLMLHPIAYVRTHPEDAAASELLQRMFAEPPGS
jgi:glutamyl-tRNA reductase